MSISPDDLRVALRRISGSPPAGSDPVAGVERRIRRNRRRRRAAVGGCLVVLVVAGALLQSSVLHLGQSAVPASPEQQQRDADAALKYATFVAWWDGSVVGAHPQAPDIGVTGVEVATTAPPFTCAAARPSAAAPAGTQAAWVLGEGSASSTGSLSTGVVATTTTYVIWPTGVTSCEPRPPAVALAAPPPSVTKARVASGLVYGQRLGSPGSPALDVEALYRSVPPDRLTQYGRDVFAAYESATVDYGTAAEQTDRVLVALGSWLPVALATATAAPTLRQSGPATLQGGGRVGSAELPAGYTARWDKARGTFCVDGSTGGSAVRHVSDANFDQPGAPPTPDDGLCP